MPLPVGVETVTVQSGAPLTLLDGTVMRGRLIFTGPDLLTIGDDELITGGSVEVALVDGELSVALCATDATGMSPTGWTYKVTAVLTNAPGWIRYISLPKATPVVALADVLVPDPVAAEYAVLAPVAEFLANLAALDADVAALVVALAAKATLTGATFTGPVTVSGADLAVLGAGKGYRFRRNGGGLDLEGTGADLILSMWSGPAFDGDQHNYDRYAADAGAAQHAGRREFVKTLYGDVVHTIDPDAETLGFFRGAPVGKRVVAGSRASGAALASLLAAAAAYGLITDTTTA